MPAPKDPQKREEWIRKLQGNTNAKGHKLTDEQKKSMGAQHIGNQYSKGQTRTPEQRGRMSEAKKQYWINATEEHRERTRAQLLQTSGYWTGKKRPDIGAIISAKNKGNIPPNKGIPATPEQRAKSSEIHKQQWANATEEQRLKMITPWINASKDKKNTTIEQFIATKLDQQGIVYVREKRIGNYYVDFYIESENKVIEVNGCWWHGCEQCGFNNPEHIEKRAKDTKRYERLQSKGYTVEVLWEHDLRKEMKDMG
jgi:G:T-mismatch repair DNA endonuclease (very short patch repair protein)